MNKNNTIVENSEILLKQAQNTKTAEDFIKILNKLIEIKKEQPLSVSDEKVLIDVIKTLRSKQLVRIKALDVKKRLKNKTEPDSIDVESMIEDINDNFKQHDRLLENTLLRKQSSITYIIKFASYIKYLDDDIKNVKDAQKRPKIINNIIIKYKRLLRGSNR